MSEPSSFQNVVNGFAPRYEFRNEKHRHHEEPMPSTWLVWSVLVTVFCCFIPGIIAIIFSSQVSSRYYGGDIEGAKRASRMAEIWIIVSFVLGVITATFYFPFMLLGW
ncbi:MAG: CD225/dispanin family protein [Muribaculaceae bacterium]|nr:CD225/dispanin family protein [Muribaculaceae bacterium]